MKLKDVSVGTKVRWEGELFTVMGEDVPDRTGQTGYKWGRGERDWISDDAEVTIDGLMQRVIPGTYGKVRVTEGGYVHCKSMRTAEEIRDTIATLEQIAGAM